MMFIVMFVVVMFVVVMVTRKKTLKELHVFVFQLNIGVFSVIQETRIRDAIEMVWIQLAAIVLRGVLRIASG